MSEHHNSGFVRSPQPTDEVKAALAVKKADAFQSSKRRMITPAILWGIAETTAPIIPETVKVRNVELANTLTPAEKTINSGKKRGRKAKDKPPVLGLNQAIVRTIGDTSLLVTEEKKDINSLPAIKTETRKDVNEAFSATQKGNGRVDLRFEGVRVGSIGPKDKMRVNPPSTPTWFLYSGDQEYPIPHTFPLKSHLVGVDVRRIQAAFVNNMIGEGTIDSAVYALPLGEGEELSKQWKHLPHMGRIVHTDSIGKIMATQVTVGHEFKESKPDEPRFRVAYVMTTPNGPVSRDCWLNSEAQARSAAMDLLAGGMVSKVTVYAPSNKELDSTKYPPSVLSADRGRPVQCWKFEGSSAMLTRTGFAALQPDTARDEFTPSRKRGPISRHVNYNRTAIWQKAKNDTCSFSRG